MIDEKEVKKFVESQKSLHLYKKAQDAFVDVLGRLSKEEFHKATDNLIIMAIHDDVTGQVMHFEPTDKKFAVMQLTLKKDLPPSVLKRIISHELCHVLQGRNWQESDGFDLEREAMEFSDRLGFKMTPEIEDWKKRNKYNYL